MTDKPPSELMREHDELADKEEQHRREKLTRRQQIGDALETVVESVVADNPPAAEVYDVNETGETHSMRLRLDRAEILKELSEQLPEEFSVQHIRDDGTISVRWVEQPIGEQEHLSAAIRGIIAAETPNDEFKPIKLEWDEVVSRAESLGFDTETVERRLHEMDDFDVINVFEQDGTKVSKGELFQTL
jgi:hypothetical protein